LAPTDRIGARATTLMIEQVVTRVQEASGLRGQRVARTRIRAT
jgi:hypothetical protein